jgi:CRISPR-associated protein Cmr5
MRTIQQQRAKAALERVRKVIGQLKEAKERKEFRAHTQGLPFMIHANGLGQAYAFYLANGGDDKKPKQSYRAICDTLAEWLTAESQPCHGQWQGRGEREKLLDAITRIDMSTYLLAQAEAIAYMSWVKRFADALIHE